MEIYPGFHHFLILLCSSHLSQVLPVIQALGGWRGRSWVQGQPGLHSETLSQKKWV
jgi:hypothetical protein